MTIVTSYDWESDTCTHHAENAARKVWREAVAEIAEKAKATLPECNGQVPSAPDPVPVQADAPTVPPTEAPVPEQPEAPAEAPQGIPAQYVVHIQGRPFVRFAGLLKMAHERGLVQLTTRIEFHSDVLGPRQCYCDL